MRKNNMHSFLFFRLFFSSHPPFLILIPWLPERWWCLTVRNLPSEGWVSMVLGFSVSWGSFWGLLFTVGLTVCLRDSVHLSPGCRADAAFAIAKEGRQWEAHKWAYQISDRGLRKTIKWRLTNTWWLGDALFETFLMVVPLHPARRR